MWGREVQEQCTWVAVSQVFQEVSGLRPSVEGTLAKRGIQDGCSCGCGQEASVLTTQYSLCGCGSISTTWQVALPEHVIKTD